MQMPEARRHPSSITELAEVGVSSCGISDSYACLMSWLKLRLFVKMHLSHKTSVAALYKGLLTGIIGWSLWYEPRWRWYINIMEGKEIRVTWKIFILPWQISIDQMLPNNTTVSHHVNKYGRAHSLLSQQMSGNYFFFQETMSHQSQMQSFMVCSWMNVSTVNKSS